MARIVYKKGFENQNRLECIEGIEIEMLNGQCALIYPKYEDLPKFIKEKVEIAEKVKFYDVSFKNFLQLRKISENEFKNKNPKTKLDILYEWLFENKLDVGVLDM